MAIYQPPSYTVPFSGIIFNSSYFTSTNGSSLSVNQANTLYLRKTFSDTATALETFNAGISTPSITSASTLDLQNQLIRVGSTQTATGAITVGSALSTTTMNGKVIASTIDSSAALNVNTNVSTNIVIGNPLSGLNTTTLQGKGVIIGTSGNTSSTQVYGTTTDLNAVTLNLNGSSQNNLGTTVGNTTKIGYDGGGGNTTIQGSTIQMGTNQQNTHTTTIGTNNGNITTTNVQGQNLNLTAGTTASLQGATTTINGTTTILQGATSLTSNNIHTFAFPLKLSYTPDNIVSGQLGFSVKYSVSSGSVSIAGSVPVAFFTNIPTGIYLLTIGSFTVFGLDINDRVDLQYISSSNVTYLAGTSNMEFGGNLQEKLGICITVPFMITNATNQLTMSLVSIIGNGFSYTGGASCILRIA
jgi:hypothetical protein